MKKILVPIPDELKDKLNYLRTQGFTINEITRHALTRALARVRLPRRRRAA